MGHFATWVWLPEPTKRSKERTNSIKLSSDLWAFWLWVLCTFLPHIMRAHKIPLKVQSLNWSIISSWDTKEDTNYQVGQFTICSDGLCNSLDIQPKPDSPRQFPDLLESKEAPLQHRIIFGSSFLSFCCLNGQRTKIYRDAVGLSFHWCVYEGICVNIWVFRL